MKKTAKASKRNIKADSGDQIIDLLGLLYDVTDKYNTSHPVSGDWDTEANHEMLTISDAFNISTESAKALMINELGFSERDFQLHNNLTGSTDVEGNTNITSSKELSEKEMLDLLDHAQFTVSYLCKDFGDNEYVDDVKWGKYGFRIPVFQSNPRGPESNKPDKMTRQFEFHYDPDNEDYNAEEQLHVQLDEFFQEWQEDLEGDYNMTSQEYIEDLIDEITYQVYDNYNGEPGYTYEDYAQAIIKHLESDYEWTLDEEFTMEDVYKAMDDYTWTY